VDVHKLVDQVLDLAGSDENQRRIAQRRALLSREPDRDLQAAGGFIPPVYVRLNRPYVASRIGVNLRDLFRDLEAYLHLEMMTKIIKFTEFDEDTPIVPDVMLQFGVAWEPSLCAIPWIEVDGEEPWAGEPILSSPHDADYLEIPQDFSQVGMMPQTLRIYEQAQQLLGNRIKVHFPDWLSGPTRLVQKLRGEENFFLDLYDNPPGVHKIFEYTTELRRSFESFRRRLVGTGPGPGELYYWEFKTLANDEVNAQLLSPKHYREFVYPYDLEYCRDYEHVYFHGSGVFTPYFETIKTLPNLAMIEISDWSDIAKASQVFGQSVILERTFLQTEEALVADTVRKGEILSQLVEGAKGTRFYFILNVDNRDEGIEDTIREWVRLSREAIAKHFEIE
jgi:hypothetical protein